MPDELTVLTRLPPIKMDTVVSKIPEDKPTVNGAIVNGGHHHQHQHEHESHRRETVTITRHASTSTEHHYGHHHHSQHSTEFDHMLEHAGTVEGFLDFVASLRLRRMPHKGSKWDRVLQWAEFFASSVANYETCMRGSVAYDQEAAKTIWSNCRILLELGSSHIVVLEQVFVVFYNAGMVLVELSSNDQMFSASVHIRRALSETFGQLIHMVAEVAAYYSTRRLVITASDFHVVFGTITEAFFGCQHTISEAMWTYQLSQSGVIGIGIEEIRRFLSPNDRVIEMLLSNRLGSRSKREEYSCEWFDQHLRGFTQSSDKTFLVTGQPGFGKSVISEWIIERLRRSRGPKAYDVLSFAVYADIKSERSSLSIVKNLLLQLLDRSVGDVEFYTRMARIMRDCDHDSVKTEDALWKTLAATLACRNRNTMIVIDGLDQVVGTDGADVKALERINEAVAASTIQGSKIRAIILSRPVAKAGKHHVRLFKIEEQHIVADVEKVIRTKLMASSLSALANGPALQEIVDGLLSSADGSFLWAKIAIEVLQREASLQGVKATLRKLPKNTNDLVRLLLDGLNLQSQDTQSVLAWISAARRPFTTAELKAFLSIDISKPARSTRLGNIEDDLVRCIGPLIVVRNGVVRFRHHAIRKIIMEFDGQIQGLPSRQPANTDLAIRCMAYARLCLADRMVPSQEHLSRDVMLGMFQKHECLEYVARYWVVHFQNSTLWGKGGKHALTNDFKRCFSTSTTLAVLEYTCWETQWSISEAVSRHEVALSVRRLLAGDAKECLLQTMISLAHGYQRLHKLEMACGIFYEAYKVGHGMFGTSSHLVAFLAMGYIDCHGTVTIIKGSEVAIRREELLIYLMKFCKHAHGASDGITIKYTRLLVQYYLNIKAVDLAVVIQRDLFRMCIEHFGRAHEHTVESYTVLIKVLTECKMYEEITLLEIENYEYCRRHLSLSEFSVITAALSIIRYYESIGECTKAEQILVELWQSISHAVQHECTTILLERKIQVAVHYSEFLIRYKRTEEVKGILIGVWSEYKEMISSETTICSEVVLKSILVVGRTLKQCKVLTVAKSIFQSIHSYCKRTQTLTSTLAIECSISLTETIQEIIETRMTLTSTSEYSSEETEEITEILEEIFESSLESVTTIETETTTEVSRSSETKSTTTSTVSVSVYTSLTKIAETLSTIHIEKKQWHEALAICRKSLETVWKSLFTQGTVEMCGHARAQSFVLARRMAECYFHTKQVTRAETIYVRMFQACKGHLHAHDELLIRVANELIEFYETTYQFEKALDILVQLYTVQRSCKHDHEITIGTVYRLARYCTELRNTVLAETYYKEIVTIYTSSTGVITYRGIEATLALCRIHRETCAWESARHFYGLLWKTFTTCTEGYDWTGLLVEEIFNEYFDVLDVRLRVAYSVCLEVSEAYRSRCVTVFGSHQETTIRATLNLASVYERKEEYVQKAITLYEEVIKATTTTKTTTTVSTATLKKITQSRERLAKLYTKKSSTTSKGLVIYKEEFKKTVAKHSYSSSQSLLQLQETIEAFMSVKTEETITQSMELLSECVSHIMTKESHSETLFEAAQTIAKLYIKIERKEVALTMLKEMRHQLIKEDYTITTTVKFSLKGIDRRAYAFLVAFEQTLHGFESHSHFSEVMALLVTETILYQSYARAIKTGGKYSVAFGHGCRLAVFYRSHERHEEYKALEIEILQGFAAFLKIKETTDHFRVFFLVCLGELGQEEKSYSVLTIMSARILGCVNRGSFTEAYDFAVYLDKFMHEYESFKTQRGIMVAFQIACYLAGKRRIQTCTDTNVRKRMLKLSAVMLKEALEGMQTVEIDFTSMSIDLVNEVCGVLGQNGNYEALEVSACEWSTYVFTKLLTRPPQLQIILSSLWTSRHARSSWSSSTIVAIGRRLVEVRFTLPKRALAIDLCQDICYNLQRVWGRFDPTTVEMFHLLSALYAAEGNHPKVMSLQQDLLKDLLTAYEEDGTVEKPRAAVIAVDEMRRLKRTFLRAGGWNKNQTEWKGLFDGLHEAFHGEGCWKASKTVNLGFQQWDASGAFKADDMGIWRQPFDWEFLLTEEGDATAFKHHNNLRKTSGLLPVKVNRGISGSVSVPAFRHEHHHHDHGLSKGNVPDEGIKRHLSHSRSVGAIQEDVTNGGDVVGELHAHIDYQAPAKVAVPAA
jgi:hypothetical protein